MIFLQAESNGRQRNEIIKKKIECASNLQCVEVSKQKSFKMLGGGVHRGSLRRYLRGPILSLTKGI